MEQDNPSVESPEDLEDEKVRGRISQEGVKDHHLDPSDGNIDTNEDDNEPEENGN